MFRFIDEEEHNYRRKHQTKAKSNEGSIELATSYEILGLTENASEIKIKKRYRKLAMQHHPDRLIHLGMEHQKSAKEKFQAISNAYECIKTKKGFS